VTTTAEQLTAVDAEHAKAVAAARTLEAERDRLTAAGDAARRARRTEIWRQQLAQLEAENPARDIAAARELLTASVRGEDLATSPIVRLYDFVAATQRALMIARLITDRRESLRLPAQPRMVPPRVDPLAELSTVLEAEAARTAQLEADQLAREIEAAWRDETLPPIGARLDPSAYLRRQDAVARAAEHLNEARDNLAAAEHMPEDDRRRPAAIAGAEQALEQAESASRHAAA
jgi:hypothetical protein